MEPKRKRPVNASMLGLSDMHQGKASAWITSVLFLIVAVFLSLILPALLTPDASPNAIRLPGKVESLNSQFLSDDTEPVFYPTFSYELNGKRETFRSNITSDQPMYEEGEDVIVVVDPADPSKAFVENDKNLTSAIWIMRIVSAFFLLIGGVVFVMLLRGENIALINRVGGLLGALSFGIPASLALPALWAIYEARPNALFQRDSPFDQTTFFIGLMFSVLGLITIVASIALYRYQAKTGLPEWTWILHWVSDRKKKTL